MGLIYLKKQTNKQTKNIKMGICFCQNDLKNEQVLFVWFFFPALEADPTLSQARIQGGGGPAGPGPPPPPPPKKKRGEKGKGKKRKRKGERERETFRCHNLFFCAYIGLH